MPTPPLVRGQRGTARARLNLTARLVTFGGTTSCVLVDLSRTGAKIVAGECPRVGNVVVVEGSQSELFGTVRWCAKGVFGFEFDTPISDAAVIAFRRHADGEMERQRRELMTYARRWVTGRDPNAR